jgi:hypothetical protein
MLQAAIAMEAASAARGNETGARERRRGMGEILVVNHGIRNSQKGFIMSAAHNPSVLPSP